MSSINFIKGNRKQTGKLHFYTYYVQQIWENPWLWEYTHLGNNINAIPEQFMSSALPIKEMSAENLSVNNPIRHVNISIKPFYKLQGWRKTLSSGVQCHIPVYFLLSHWHYIYITISLFTAVIIGTFQVSTWTSHLVSNKSSHTKFYWSGHLQGVKKSFKSL